MSGLAASTALRALRFALFYPEMFTDVLTRTTGRVFLFPDTWDEGSTEDEVGTTIPMLFLFKPVSPDENSGFVA
jgi:hypothetical protein